MTAIQISNLSFSYPPQGRKPGRSVLKNLSFSIPTGEIFGLLGPNGGGKTTLFRILTTLATPQSGSATLFDSDSVQSAADVRKKIGVIFQNPSLDKRLTVLENMRHQGHLYGFHGMDLNNRINARLREFNLLDRQNDIVSTLSGGLQRRVEIAKGILHDPRLLLMDEPSVGLDPGARRDLWAILKQLQAAGTTILLTTHLMDEAEQCTQLAILHEGRLVAQGTPAELKSLIGGDVITLQGKDPETLLEKIKSIYPKGVSNVGGTIRIEEKNGHQQIPNLVEKLSGLLESVSVGKPTLDDVFIHLTGASLYENPSAEGAV